MRRSFKPMPGDHIDDEDERCRVNNFTFNENRKRQRERKEKLVFGILCAIGIILALAFVWIMSSPR